MIHSIIKRQTPVCITYTYQSNFVKQLLLNESYPSPQPRIYRRVVVGADYFIFDRLQNVFCTGGASCEASIFWGIVLLTKPPTHFSRMCVCLLPTDDGCYILREIDKAHKFSKNPHIFLYILPGFFS